MFSTIYLKSKIRTFAQFNFYRCRVSSRKSKLRQPIICNMHWENYRCMGRLTFFCLVINCITCMICDTSMETPCYCVVHLAKGQCSKRLSSAASLYKRDAGKKRAGQLETQTLREKNHQNSTIIRSKLF